MRVLEAIFIAITLISCILWLLPRVSIYLKIFFTLSAAILGILQCLLEGYRTAMLPAYVLVTGLLIYRVWRWRKPQVTCRRRKLLLILLSLYVLLAAILPLLLPVFQLEKPDGSFVVGTKSFVWDYRSTTSPASGLPSSEHITLHVQFWYPAEQTTIQHPMPPTRPYSLQQQKQACQHGSSTA